MEGEYHRQYTYGAMLEASASQDVLDQYKYDQRHHKAIFDALIEALEMERPYKDKGKPAPWSKQTRVVKKEITHNMVDQMVARAKDRVIAWSKTGAGTRLVPPPPPQLPNQDDHQTHHQQHQ